MNTVIVREKGREVASCTSWAAAQAVTRLFYGNGQHVLVLPHGVTLQVILRP